MSFSFARGPLFLAATVGLGSLLGCSEGADASDDSTPSAGSGGAGSALDHDPGAAGSPGSAGSATGNAEVTRVWDFEDGISGWSAEYAAPAALQAASTLEANPDDGNPDGALQLTIPFEANNPTDADGVGAAQKLTVQFNLTENPVDLSNATVSADIKLVSGFATNEDHRGGVKLFVKTGAGYSYADGGFNDLEGADWIHVSFTPGEIVSGYIDDAAVYNPTDVYTVGLEFATGDGDPALEDLWEEAVILVDNFSY